MKFNTKKRITKFSVILLSVFTGIAIAVTTQAAALKSSSSMTIITTRDWWPNSTCASPPAVRWYTVTEKMSNVRIRSDGLHWNIAPGNTFAGGYARIWAFWSKNGGKTWTSSGWDYTQNSATFKHAEGYGDGSDWVGQMISTICDQKECFKDPNACNGRKRSNIVFVAN